MMTLNIYNGKKFLGVLITNANSDKELYDLVKSKFPKATEYGIKI